SRRRRGVPFRRVPPQRPCRMVTTGGTARCGRRLGREVCRGGVRLGEGARPRRLRGRSRQGREVRQRIEPPRRAHGRVDRAVGVLGRRRDRDQTYEGLRALALGAVADGLEPPSADHPRVSGVAIDVPSGGSYATIVAPPDNTTSMYTSVA